MFPYSIRRPKFHHAFLLERPQKNRLGRIRQPFLFHYRAHRRIFFLSCRSHTRKTKLLPFNRASSIKLGLSVDSGARDQPSRQRHQHDSRVFHLKTTGTSPRLLPTVRSPSGSHPVPAQIARSAPFPSPGHPIRILSPSPSSLVPRVHLPSRKRAASRSLAASHAAPHPYIPGRDNTHTSRGTLRARTAHLGRFRPHRRAFLFPSSAQVCRLFRRGSPPRLSRFALSSRAIRARSLSSALLVQTRLAR